MTETRMTSAFIEMPEDYLETLLKAHHKMIDMGIISDPFEIFLGKMALAGTAEMCKRLTVIDLMTSMMMEK